MKVNKYDLIFELICAALLIIGIISILYIEYKLEQRREMVSRITESSVEVFEE